MTNPNQTNPDQIPAGITSEQAKKAREWALRALNRPGASNTEEKAVARVVIGAVPEPPRPTMADMTPMARRDCQWMQCDVSGERRIITLVLDDHNYAAVTLAPSGYFSRCSFESVTPRPDLPPLTWPGTEKADDENTVKIGDEIESAADPRIDALPVGSILLDRDGERVTRFDINSSGWRGPGYKPIPPQGAEFGPWTVVRIGREADQ